MKNNFESPKEWIQAEYLERRKRNVNYSLRSFSRLLDIPSGRVSQLLSEKRGFTPRMGKKIALRLSYDPQKTSQLLDCIASSRKKRSENLPQKTYQPLDMDFFQTIADPLHYSVLSLCETKNFDSSIRMISRRLRVSPVEARAAVDRLLRLGLLKNEAGKLMPVHSTGITTSHDVQSAALREAHKKVLEESMLTLEEVAVELRDITSITMAINMKKLPEAKKKIRAFRRSLSEFLEIGPKTQVYRLNVQLVPVSSGEEK